MVDGQKKITIRTTFKGLLDDLVYDDSLSASDVAKIYGNGNGDLQVLADIEVAGVIDTLPLTAKNSFPRNGFPGSFGFNISEDLTITNGTIDTDSLNYEGNGTYVFNSL